MHQRSDAAGDETPQSAEGYTLSLTEALAAGETGAQSLQGGRLHNVFLPNRFNGHQYWLTSGERKKRPTTKIKHRRMAGILTLARLQGLELTMGWQTF